jgi:hypothetical protein
MVRLKNSSCLNWMTVLQTGAVICESSYVYFFVYHKIIDCVITISFITSTILIVSIKN